MDDELTIFDRIEMTEAARLDIPAKTGLIDLFFGGREPQTHSTAFVMVDIRRNSRAAAQYSKRGTAGNSVTSNGYDNVPFVPPYICEHIPTKASDLLKRDVGTDPYAIQKQEERAANKLADDIATLKQRAKRAEVKQVADAIKDGEITVVEDGVSRTISYNMPAANKLILLDTDLWTDTVNSDPIEDIKNMRDIIQEASGLDVDAMVFGADVLTAFTNHPKVKAYYDNRRIVIGEIKPEKMDNGLIKYGDVELIDIYGFNEWILDTDTGINTPVVPKDTILFGSTHAHVSIEYGAVELVDDQYTWVEEGTYFADSYTNKETKTMEARLQSSPLYALTQSDAFGSAVVI